MLDNVALYAYNGLYTRSVGFYWSSFHTLFQCAKDARFVSAYRFVKIIFYFSLNIKIRDNSNLCYSAAYLPTV